LIQRETQDVRQSLEHIQGDVLQKEIELQKAKERIERLEKELDECRTQVFGSIPSFEVTDASILEGLTTLRWSLSNWVEGLPDIQNFQRAWQNTVRNHHWMSRLRAEPDMFPDGLPAAQSELLEQWLFSILLRCVFEVVLVGASSSDLRVLQGLQDGIHRLEPRKGILKSLVGTIYMLNPFHTDPKSIDLWKSDLLRAYASQPRYREQLTTRCGGVTKTTVDFMVGFIFTEETDWAHKFNRYREQIIEPAAELSLKMSCSTKQYRWEWYEGNEWFSDGLVRKRDIEHFTIVDARTHNRIPRDKFTEFSDDATIGDLLLVVYPALFRCGKDVQKDILIEKAVIIIRLNEPRQQVKTEANDAGPEKQILGPKRRFLGLSINSLAV
jgi:hypothetical protein